MNTSRTYTMTARARSVEQTRDRILDATATLHMERLAREIGLDDIAGRADVSVQTVLRHFGNREALVDAAVARSQKQVLEERRAPAGDVEGAVRVIVAHYELRGDGVLLLLAQESSEEFARRITDTGRALHRRWVTEVFAPYVGDDDALIDLLVVATDVYTWKLLRRDRGLSRARTTRRITDLVRAVLGPTAT
jgi:AcrR family transcriptional regulator